MTTAAARASNRIVPAPRPITQYALAGSAVLGLALTFVGLRALLTGSFPTLFGITLTVLGVAGVGLAALSWKGQRAAWAMLTATWAVVAFCAFFATPKVVELPQLKQVTVDLELTLGREKAEAKIDSENLLIRLQNLAACTLFALPFGLLSAGLAVGGRDFERRS